MSGHYDDTESGGRDSSEAAGGPHTPSSKHHRPGLVLRRPAQLSTLSREISGMSEMPSFLRVPSHPDPSSCNFYACLIDLQETRPQLP